jgi:hypothetical protein
VTIALVSAGLAASDACFAGPPYVTDDPVPTDRGRWEIYQFANGTSVAGEIGGAVGLDINYGGAEDLQLTAVLPASVTYNMGATATAGTIELAAKYRFVHEDTLGTRPAVSVFPRIFVATHAGMHRHVRLLLPLWAGKNFGRWAVFGGGGFLLNPGQDQRNSWQTGVAASRALGHRASAGIELYHRTAESADGKAYTGASLGVTWQLANRWSLLAAGGPGVQNARQEGTYSFYLAVKYAN